MLALLSLFDNLLSDNQQFDSLATALRSLCRVLQIHESTPLGNLQSSSLEASSTSAFKTPYIRAIAYRALGIQYIDEVLTNQSVGWSELMDETTRYIFWNISMLDPQSVWKLRAWLIFNTLGHNFCDLVTRFLEDSFRQTSTLVRGCVSAPPKLA